MSNSNNLNNGMSAAEQASEKYLGQSYLKDLNFIAPNISSQKLSFLINDANNLLEHCNQKYSFDILDTRDTFKKQINTILQVIEIDLDQAKINQLSASIQEEIVVLSKQLEQLNNSLNPLSEIYMNEDYLNNIIPSEADQARLAPRIIGVVQIATLKRETIVNVIAQAKGVDNDLINFSDATMFQIREGLSRLGDTTALKSEVLEKVSKKLIISDKALNLSAFTKLSSIALIVFSVAFGVVGFPLPSNTIGAGASFVFIFFILSLSLLPASLYMMKNKSDNLVVYRENYARFTVVPLVIGIIGILLSGGYMFVYNSNAFEFFQLLPLAALIVAVLGIFFLTTSVLTGKYVLKARAEMLDYKIRLNAKKIAN